MKFLKRSFFIPSVEFVRTMRKNQSFVCEAEALPGSSQTVISKICMIFLPICNPFHFSVNIGISLDITRRAYDGIRHDDSYIDNLFSYNNHGKSGNTNQDYRRCKIK